MKQIVCSVCDNNFELIDKKVLFEVSIKMVAKKNFMS